MKVVKRRDSKDANVLQKCSSCACSTRHQQGRIWFSSWSSLMLAINWRVRNGSRESGHCKSCCWQRCCSLEWQLLHRSDRCEEMLRLDGQCPSGCCKKWLVGRFGLQQVAKGLPLGHQNILYDSVDELMAGQNCTRMKTMCVHFWVVGYRDQRWIRHPRGGLQEKATQKIGWRATSCKCVFAQRCRSIPIHSEYDTSFALDTFEIQQSNYTTEAVNT